MIGNKEKTLPPDERNFKPQITRMNTDLYKMRRCGGKKWVRRILIEFFKKTEIGNLGTYE